MGAHMSRAASGVALSLPNYLLLSAIKVAFLGFSGHIIQFSSVQSLSRVLLFVSPWTAARQASLSITHSQSLLKLMSIESVMPSSHLILCHPLLLLPLSLSQNQGLFQ